MTTSCATGFVGVDVSAFRSDAYDLLNHPNFAAPSTLRGRGDFSGIGSILNGITGRQIQLSLRLEF